MYKIVYFSTGTQSSPKLNEKGIFDYLVGQGYLKAALIFDEELAAKLNLNLSEVSTPELQPDEEMVSIKGVMKERLHDIEIFKNGGTDIHKALIFIMKSDLKINKEVLEATKLKVYIHPGPKRVEMNRTIFKNLKCIKQGKFTRFRSVVESEEILILKALDEILSKTEIQDYKKLLTDFREVLPMQWPCEFLGFYLSKHLKKPRHPLKVAEFAINTCARNTGPLTDEEYATIKNYLTLTKGPPNCGILAQKLNRPYGNIQHEVERIVKGIPNVKPSHFSIDEDIQIMKFGLGNKEPQNIEELNTICKRGMIKWTKIDSNMPVYSCRSRWNYYIKPTLMAYLSGCLGQKWQKDFLLFVLETKPVHLSEVDFDKAQKLWPFVTRHQMIRVLNNCGSRKRDPLCKLIEKRLEGNFQEDITEHQQALIQAFKEM